MVHRSDVEEARHRIAGLIRTTPVLQLERRPPWGRAFFKLEMLQHAGSFKVRGAFNRQLRAQQSGQLDSRVGVVVASGGNAGMAHAYAASQLGVPATVFVPESAPAVKIAKLEQYGARIIRAGSEYATAFAAAQEEVSRSGALYCHAYDQPDVVAGAGTLGLELRAQIPEPVDTVIVAVGGGGLMAGVAAALEGSAHIVGVEPSGAPTLHTALQQGRPVDVPVNGIAADSLGARRLGDIAYEVAVRTDVTSIMVTDDDIRAARSLLWDQWRIVVEHGAATALAAVTTGAYRPDPHESVAIVLCGGNTDPSDL